MPQLEDIIQEIALAGDDDVIQAFSKIGKAGLEAFERIGEAVGGATEALAGFAGVLGGVSGALFLWARHAAEAAHSLNMLANQTGESVESISALKGALSALGGSGEGLETAFRRMGNTITREWDQVKKQVRDASDVVINDNLRVDQSSQSLFQAQQARAKAYGQAGASPARLEQEKRLEADTKLEAAEQAYHEANKKRAEDRLNAPKAYGKAVDEIIHGEKNFAEASKEANLSVDNVIKGLLINTEGAEEAFKNFHGGVNELIGEGPELKQVFYNLADFLKNSQNAALNNSVAMHLLGRGVTNDLVAPMLQGSEALKATEAQLKSTGMTITKEMLKPAEEFHEAYKKLTSDLTTTTSQIGLKLGPLFTEGLEGFSKFIEENHEAIMRWADDAVHAVSEVGEGFSKAFGEIKESGATAEQAIKDITKAIEESAKQTRLFKTPLGQGGPSETLFDLFVRSNAVRGLLGEKGIEWLRSYLGTPEEMAASDKEAKEKRDKEKAEQKAKEKKKGTSEEFVDAPGPPKRFKIPDDQAEEDVRRRELERRFNMRFPPERTPSDIDRLNRELKGERRVPDVAIPLSEEERKKREIMGLRTVPDIKEFKKPEDKKPEDTTPKKISFQADDSTRIKTETPKTEGGEECCIPGPTIDDATKSLKEFVIPVNLTTEAMRKMPESAESTATSLAKMSKPVNDTAASLTKVSASAADIEKGFQQVAAPTSRTGDAMIKAAPATDQVTEAMNKLAAAIAALIQLLKSTGAKGAPGPQGEKGPQGPQGEQGTSATTSRGGGGGRDGKPNGGGGGGDGGGGDGGGGDGGRGPVKRVPIEPGYDPKKFDPSNPDTWPKDKPGKRPRPDLYPDDDPTRRYRRPGERHMPPLPDEQRPQGERGSPYANPPEPKPPPPLPPGWEWGPDGKAREKPDVVRPAEPQEQTPQEEQAPKPRRDIPQHRPQRQWPGLPKGVPKPPPRRKEDRPETYTGGDGEQVTTVVASTTAAVVSEAEQQRRNEAADDYQRYVDSLPDNVRYGPEIQFGAERLRRGMTVTGDVAPAMEQQGDQEQPEQKSGGGPVGGWGGPKSDSVPIMASKGEYVVTADGSNLGDAIQHFTGKGYAAGGTVITTEDQKKKKKKKSAPGEPEPEPESGGVQPRGSQLDTAVKGAKAEWDAALHSTGFAEGGEVNDATQQQVDAIFDTARFKSAPKLSEMTPEQKEWESQRPELGPSASGKADPIISDDALLGWLAKGGVNLGIDDKKLREVLHQQETKGYAEGGEVDAQQVAYKSDPGVSEFRPEQFAEPIPSGEIPKGILDKEGQWIQPRGLHLPRPIPGAKIDPDQPPPGDFYSGFERQEQKLAEGGPVIDHALWQLARGFAGGGLVNGFTHTVANITGYSNGGAVASKPEENNTLGYHNLDLRTDAGSFTAKVSEDTMKGIRDSSLNGKLTRLSQFPSWYS